MKSCIHAGNVAQQSTIYMVASNEDKSSYRKISNIKRTKSPNLNVSRPVMQLSLPNPMKPGVKSRMKM